MARRYSCSDKEKWTADTSSPPPPPRCAPVRIPASDPTGLIAENKLTIIGRITNPKFQRPRAFRVEVNGLLPLEMKMEILLPSEEVTEVEFQYLKIEKHCFTCFSLLHEEENCPSRPRGARAPKDRILGITQAYALKRIEAKKQKNNDRRSYRRPEPQQFVAKRQNQTGRDDHHHYSVDRDTRFPPVGHVSHHLNRPLIEATTHRRQNDEIMRTPEASVSRGSIRGGSGGSIADEQMIYPVNPNPSGGHSSSRERIPARDRLPGQSNERVPARERLSGGD
ncbi:unnamed protein product, partial [Brassica napus]